MSNKQQRDKCRKEEQRAGQRDEHGRRLPGPGGRPLPEVRCFHCGKKFGDVLVMSRPGRPRGIKMKCPRCKRFCII